MVHSFPAKILVGINLDADESKELLCWAIRVLAQPGDTVVAMHVIVAKPNKIVKDGRKEEKNKNQSAKKHQKQIRQAKSFVISIMGELFKTCQSNQVNLEARVGLNSSAGKGLIEEAKTMAADYLVINKRMNRKNRMPSTISMYCCENVPDCCSLVLLRRTERLQKKIHSNSIQIQEFDQQSSFTENSFSSGPNSISSDKKREKASPRTVLNIREQESESNTEEEDSLNSGESCRTNNSSLATEFSKEKQEIKKPMSPFKLISSLFTRKESDAFSIKEKQQPLLKCFTYHEIAKATRNFYTENLVGEGGYSEVYRGDLANGRRIAVKRLAKDNSNANKEKEFLMELGIIGHVNHPNTAKLVGYCIENGLYLIFKFYPNGTLFSALHGQTCKSLDWPIRYRIVIGIAKGLHYLHNNCKHRIIHRDIKASNVLLGPDYEPQISDFGLAKWLPSKWTHHAVIPIEGTFGYLAPEYFMHGIVDEKVDVFALGILLLEIITGRRPVDSTKQNLLLWAMPLMESGNLRELVDPKLEGRYDLGQLHRVALTASHCVRQSSIWRPSTTEVLQLLTYSRDSDVTSWKIPKFTSEDEMDDYSMILGYQLPSDLALEDI
ncbi:hypothetical protein ACJIZ3_005431 [Penstemon smallii]|uniref:Protein kinase domain-containing protein n=1 Tax=Penstemon smallii TaxID=265156 RepID=A0ABD3S4Y1_9LAMI